MDFVVLPIWHGLSIYRLFSILRIETYGRPTHKVTFSVFESKVWLRLLLPYCWQAFTETAQCDLRNQCKAG